MDGDTSIIFLAGKGVVFTEPSTDLWYEATIPGPDVELQLSNGTQVGYVMNQAASPLGCFQQWQLCLGNVSTDISPAIPDNRPGCGTMSGLVDAILTTASVFNTTADDVNNADFSDDKWGTGSRYGWFSTVLDHMGMDIIGVIESLFTQALTSTETFEGGIQGPIATSQWQNDVIHIWNTSLATMQAAFVNTAYGTTQADLQPYLLLPNNTYQEAMCQNQVRLICFETRPMQSR